MVELACQHCNYKWDYQGENEYYATCPRCRYKVRIPEDKVPRVGRKKLSLESKKKTLTEKRPVKLRGIAAIVNKVVQEAQYDKGMLIQILLKLQRSFGWLPKEMLTEISKQLEIPLSQVYQVATFYKAFSLAPRGRHLIRVCMGTSCKVRGSHTILERVQNHLSIDKDGTTLDGKFSLETVNCVGCCALGPVMTVDDDYHGNLKLPDVDRILSKYR
ncbi:MAG: NAD(P)H-dependent oxidoreductase subunit E [Candidatus Bathyarchaeota archaeon]|jgi:NADH-quinone oxidoreductase subunit E|nr:NAD(P)H-dependent oxidoreductase subunit E [Candidatus Bathyarchaeota archaeon]